MKQRFLHIFAFLMAIFVAIPMANAAAGDYKINEPTNKWTKSLTFTKPDPNSRQLAVSADGQPFALSETDKAISPYVSTYRFLESGPQLVNLGMNSAGSANAFDDSGNYVFHGDWGTAESAATPPSFYLVRTFDKTNMTNNSVFPGHKYIKMSNLGRVGLYCDATGNVYGGTGYIWFAPTETGTKIRAAKVIGSSVANKGTITPTEYIEFDTGITNGGGNDSYVQFYETSNASAMKCLMQLRGVGIFDVTLDIPNKKVTSCEKITDSNGNCNSLGAHIFMLRGHKLLCRNTRRLGSTGQIKNCYSEFEILDITDSYTNPTKIATIDHMPGVYTNYNVYDGHHTGSYIQTHKVSEDEVTIFAYVAGAGFSSYKITASAITNPVTSLSATRVSGKASDFTVSWAKPSAGIPTKYQVQYSSNGGSSWSTAIETTNLNYTYPNLAAGNYTFRVRPYYGGSGVWGSYTTSSSVVSVTAPVTSLSATISNPATNSIAVSWAKPSGDVTPSNYRISYTTDGSNWSATQETTNLSYTFSNLAAGTYTFKVTPYYGPYWGQDATSNSVEIADAAKNLAVTRQCYGEGGNSAMGTIDALVTWTGEGGKEYKVYYQTMRRDESGNRVYDNGGAWVELGSITIASGSTAGSYTHKNIQPGDGYDRIYNYKVAPYYSSTGAIGQETIIEGKGKTITAFYQSVPVDVALTQPTEERDGKKLYTFNLQLDIALNSNFSATRLDDNDAMADAYRYVIVVDETAAKWLNAATNASEIGTFVQGPVTVVANNCNHYSVDGWYLEVDIEDLKPTDDLSKGTKSLTWRNVNPGIVYQPQVYAISSRAFNFTNATATLANEPGAEAGKMVVPAPKWTLPNGNNVGITAVAGDFSSFVSNDHYPMGTFQKKGDITTPTHPITISEANTIGTIGATIEPIAIADEVIGTKNADGSYENWTWEIAYTFNLFEKNGDEWVCIRNSQKYGQISSDIETSSMYSNSQDLAFDLVGIPVGIEETTSPDGRNRLVYKPENNKEYKVVVETNYRRGADDTRIHVVGVSETLITLNPDFETPEVDPNKYSGYLFLEQSTHWDANAEKSEEDQYGGYFKYFYDAVVNVTLKKFKKDYVKYLGYYANPSFTCIGHPTATSNKWTPYQAASILIDEHVVLYNKRNPSFALKQLGYIGSEDWSKLITKSGTFPLKVHYVWAGNEKINAVEDAEFEFEMSANYPILVASTPEFRINKSLIDNKHNLAPANPLSRATNYTLQMITAVNEEYKTLVMDDVVETQLTTGVEAVAFDKGVLMVYPNPAQSEATIRSTTVLGEVKIFTIDGQLVKEFESGETTAKFNVSDLTSGVYVVSASGTTTRMIKK